MSATVGPPASLPETISEHHIEDVGLYCAEEMASKTRKELFQGNVIFLANLCAAFTVALVICSEIADSNDHKWAVRHQPPFTPRPPSPLLCLFATPFTLYYLVLITFSPLFTSKCSLEISQIKFGSMNVAYVTFLTLLWGFAASENADRVGNFPGFNQLRMYIAILAAIQTALLSLMCVAFLHEMWKSLHEDGNGYSSLPPTLVMVDDTPYIDTSRSGLFEKVDRVLNVERRDMAPVGLNDDMEKLAEQV